MFVPCVKPTVHAVKLLPFEKHVLQKSLNTHDRIYMDVGLRQNNRFSLFIISSRKEIKGFKNTWKTTFLLNNTPSFLILDF